MTKNMGTVDRGVRTVIALVIIALFIAGSLTGNALGIILGILAVVFLATAAVGFCPLYVPLKLNTRRERKEFV